MRFLEEPMCNVMGTGFGSDQGENALSAAARANPPVWDRSRAAVVIDDHSKEIGHAFKYGGRAETGLLMARMMARAGRKLVAEAHMLVAGSPAWDAAVETALQSGCLSRPRLAPAQQASLMGHCCLKACGPRRNRWGWMARPGGRTCARPSGLLPRRRKRSKAGPYSG
jgi:hypothetical protein